MKLGNFPVAAEAVTDCRLMQINAGVIFGMMRRHPEIVGSIMASMYAHFHALVAQIEQLKAQTGAQRVAEFLLELCPVESGRCALRLPYDKVLIAGRLGMKPESLSRAFNRLRKVGVVISNNNAAIADVASCASSPGRTPRWPGAGRSERASRRRARRHRRGQRGRPDAGAGRAPGGAGLWRANVGGAGAALPGGIRASGIAARGQHVERWKLPRSAYPEAGPAISPGAPSRPASTPPG